MLAENSMAQAIAYDLRRDILRGILMPGDTIKERENAEKRGVSRTPMREAIRILAQEGLVQLRPLRSPVVANPSLQDIIDQVRVLHSLELLSGELACGAATQAEIVRIGHLKDQIDRLCDIVDSVDLFELDMQFHAAIVAASHNQALIETHRAYMARLWRARYLSARIRRSRRRVLRQHGAIHQALAARNPRRIKAEIGAHFAPMYKNIESHFKTAGEHSGN